MAIQINPRDLIPIHSGCAGGGLPPARMWGPLMGVCCECERLWPLTRMTDEQYYMHVQLEEERAAFHAAQVAEREARDLVAELSTVLEKTVVALHQEVHSIYSDWRVYDQARRRVSGAT
jgi:hypothetical protein